MKAIDGRRLTGGPLDLESSGDGVRAGFCRPSLGGAQAAAVQIERIPSEAETGRGEDQDQDDAGYGGQPAPEGQGPPVHGKAFRSSSK